MISLCWLHRSLIFELIKRDLSKRYKGSIGGGLWFLIQPLYLLVVYTLAFGFILKDRWHLSGSTSEYALMLFSGLIIFNAFSECLVQSPSLITKNANYVKKIVFPLEVLPLITALSALFHALIGIVVWCLGFSILCGTPSLNVFYSMLVLLCFFPLLLGMSLLLSCVGVILRDMNYLTGMISHTLLFLSPIFYAYETAPVLLQKILLLNPLTILIQQMRLILYNGKIPSMTTLTMYFIISSLFAWGSLMLFRRLRRNFADLV